MTNFFAAAVNKAVREHIMETERLMAAGLPLPPPPPKLTADEQRAIDSARRDEFDRTYDGPRGGHGEPGALSVERWAQVHGASREELAALLKEKRNEPT